MVHGSLEGMTTNGFKVDKVMQIHQQVPDSALEGSFLMYQTLANGKVLKLMSNSVEAKIIRLLSTADIKEAPLVLDKIIFHSNSDRLKSQSYSQISTVAKIINAYPKAKVMIRGHTDSKGKKLHNQTLSLKRAKNTKESLIAKGVSPDVVSILGVGSSEPLVPNDTSLNRLKNRRIDISVIK